MTGFSVFEFSISVLQKTIDETFLQEFELTGRLHEPMMVANRGQVDSPGQPFSSQTPCNCLYEPVV